MLMRRMAIATVEISTAFASAKPAPSCSVPAPGRVTTSTPRKPTASADQRCTPTRSLRIRIDSSVVKSGAEKLMAMAPASGISLKAKKMLIIEQSCASARFRWSDQRWVRSTPNPVRGRISR